MALGAHDCQAPVEVFAPDRCDPPSLHSWLGVRYRSTAEADLREHEQTYRKFVHFAQVSAISVPIVALIIIMIAA